MNRGLYFKLHMRNKLSFIPLKQPKYTTVLLFKKKKKSFLCEMQKLLRHGVVQIGHLRAISCFVWFNLETSLIVISIIYISSEI